MYVVLTTFPAHASGNVGDKLITHSAIDILRKEKKEDEYQIFFREDDLSDKLHIVNQARAVIMPGFAIRDDMYPKVYRLTNNIEDIKVPLVPMGAGWMGFPGDFKQLSAHNYPQKTVSFVNEVARQNNHFSCRDYYTQQIVKRHGVQNSIMVGDCAWYDLNSLGQKMRQPTSIRKLVFTVGHYPLYASQAIKILNVLADLFPDSERFCSIHGLNSNAHESILNHAQQLDFKLVSASHEVESIAFYEQCDLHVGYRLHGHIAFLRKRIPSILINEDGRGRGFSYTMGIGGFDASTRIAKLEYLSIRNSVRDLIASTRNRLLGANAEQKLRSQPIMLYEEESQIIADEDVPGMIKAFLLEELDSNFRRYERVGDFIDQTYENGMKPFLDTIP